MPARTKEKLERIKTVESFVKTTLFNGENMEKPMQIFNMILFLHLLLAVLFRVVYYTSSD